MRTQISYEYPEIVINEYEKIIEAVTEKALEYEQCPYEAQVFVMLVDDETIHEINREHRGIDRPTDVLSFPMTEFREPAGFDQLEEEPDSFDPTTGELMLGDIVISMDKVKEQAENYGHSLSRELAFLTAHSMLHLMGYDHMEEKERLLMEERQEEILAQCGFTR